MPDPVARALAALAVGDTTVEIGLMWLLLAVNTEAAAKTALLEEVERGTGEELVRLREALAALDADPAMFVTVRSVAAEVDHDDRHASSDAILKRLRAGFDRAAAISPDATSALYSLGDPARLVAVTAEITGWIKTAGVRIEGADVLEIGCGPGRFLAAFAPVAGRVLGVELSATMAQEAARRLAPWRNAAVVQGSGRDLACVADASFDLVLFADSFPYVVQAGGELPARHLAEAARVLRHGGRLLVLNWAYEGSVADHAVQARRMAAAAGFAPDQLGERPFRRWDAAAFLFTRSTRGHVGACVAKAHAAACPSLLEGAL